MDALLRGDTPLLIAGLGNVLMTDDGLGVHAVRALSQAPPARVSLVEIGTAVLDAVDLFAAVGELKGHVLGLDAIRVGRRPGTICQLDLDAVAERDVLALHEPDFRAALRLIPPESRPTVTVLGMEPGSLDYGLQLSAGVQRMFVSFLSQVRRFAKTFEPGAWATRRPA